MRAFVFGDGLKAATRTCGSSTRDNPCVVLGGVAGAVEFAATRDELSIAGGTGNTGVGGLPSSNCSPLDTTIGSRGKQSILIGDDLIIIITQ
jgi:hypothetical protein